MKDILGKVTYHAVYDHSIVDALQFAKANGFAGVQVAVETPHLAFAGIDSDERRRIREYVDADGLILSLHGPDDTASLFEANPRLREGIFSYFDELFRFAEEAGAGLIAFHAGPMASFPTDTEPAERLPREDLGAYKATLAANLRRLVELAAGRFTLCIENYRMDAAVLDSVEAYLAEGMLSLCWDVAKTYDARGKLNESLYSFFTRNIEHVRQVHLHDIRNGRSHMTIGTGIVDFKLFLSVLAGADVREYCIEVRPREKAAESLARLRSLLAAI